MSDVKRPLCKSFPLDGSEWIRIAFEKHSYLDVWFAPGTIRRISAWEVKLAAHALTAELVSETEAELSSSAGGSRGEGPRGRGTRSEEAGDSAGFSERSGTDVDGTEASGVPEVASPKPFSSSLGPRRRRVPVIVRSFPGTIRQHSPRGARSSALEGHPGCARAFASESLSWGDVIPRTSNEHLTTGESNLSPRGDLSPLSLSSRTCNDGDGKPGKGTGGMFPLSPARSPIGAVENSPRLEPHGTTGELAQGSGPELSAETRVASLPGEVGDAADAADAADARGSGDEEVSVNTPPQVLAYRAQLRVGSVVLHFRAKGLRPGAFLFHATHGEDPADSSDSSDSRIGTSLPGHGAPDEGDASWQRSDTGATLPWTTLSSPRPLAGNDRDADSGHGVVGHGDTGSNGEAVDSRNGPGRRLGCWLTNETMPLCRALPWGWMDPGGVTTASEGSVDISSERPVTSGSEMANGAFSAALNGGVDGGERKHDGRTGFRRSLDSTPSLRSTPMITMWLTPSGRAPVPSICCGVCGSSWEKDALGKGFRVYHLAVANNALLWYVRRRFSEFLALHAALVKEGKEIDPGSQGVVPVDRLPTPPTRTFGLLKLFPETMERFRREQLDSYMQELLAVPEATANRLVLVFLGIVSSSRNDLMSPTDESPSAATTRGQRESPASSVPSPARLCDSPGDDVDSRRRKDSEDTRLLPAVSSSGGLGRNQGGAAELKLSLGSLDAGNGVTQPRSPVVGGAARGSSARGGEYGSVSLPPPSPEDPRRHAGGEEVREGGGVPGGANAERKVERVFNLEEAARGGDVFLFRCRGVLNQLQRWISRSEWDHVGMAVSRGDLEPLELLESVQGGVRLYPLVDRVRAYQEEGFALRVAFRKLECPWPGEVRARLADFARHVEGKAYGFLVPFHPLAAPPPRLRRTPAPFPEQPAPPGPSTPMPRRSSFSAGGWDAAGVRPPKGGFLPRRSYSVGVDHDGGGGDKASCWRARNGEETKSSSTYLCSQLVGDALQYMGVLGEEEPGDMRWLWVFPGAFGQGGLVEKGLAPGVSLGEEVG